MATSLLKRYNTKNTLKSNIYHSNKREPPPFFHSDTNPALAHALVHCFDITHVLIVALKLIWLFFLKIILSYFIPTLNKSFRYTIFRRSYVNPPVVVLTNHCQSYTAFFLDKQCTKLPHPFFCSCLSPIIAHLCNYFLLSTPVAQMLLIPRWVSRQKK